MVCSCVSEPARMMTFRIGKCQAPALPSSAAQRDSIFPASGPSRVLIKIVIFVSIWYLHDGTKERDANGRKARINEKQIIQK